MEAVAVDVRTLASSPGGQRDEPPVFARYGVASLTSAATGDSNSLARLWEGYGFRVFSAFSAINARLPMIRR